MRAVDPEAADLEALRRRAKRQLRERAKALRAAIPPAAREMRSSRVAERLLTLAELDAARAIALFWPMEARGEVDLRSAHDRLRGAKKDVFYPFMPGTGRSEPGFARVNDSASLAPFGRGFHEPPPEAPAAEPGDL